MAIDVSHWPEYWMEQITSKSYLIRISLERRDLELEFYVLSGTTDLLILQDVFMQSIDVL